MMIDEGSKTTGALWRRRSTRHKAGLRRRLLRKRQVLRILFANFGKWNIEALRQQDQDQTRIPFSWINIFFQQRGLEEHEEEQQPPDIASVNVILDEQDRNKVEK